MVSVAKERIRLWADVLEKLAYDYKHASGAKELHPIHKDLLEDMREVTGEKQKCKLCHLRSQCCDEYVIENIRGNYECDRCGRECKTYEVRFWDE